MAMNREIPDEILQESEIWTAADGWTTKLNLKIQEYSESGTKLFSLAQFFGFIVVMFYSLVFLRWELKIFSTFSSDESFSVLLSAAALVILVLTFFQTIRLMRVRNEIKEDIDILYHLCSEMSQMLISRQDKNKKTSRYEDIIYQARAMEIKHTLRKARKILHL